MNLKSSSRADAGAAIASLVADTETNPEDRNESVRSSTAGDLSAGGTIASLRGILRTKSDRNDSVKSWIAGDVSAGSTIADRETNSEDRNESVGSSTAGDLSGGSTIGSLLASRETNAAAAAAAGTSVQRRSSFTEIALKSLGGILAGDDQPATVARAVATRNVDANDVEVVLERSEKVTMRRHKASKDTSKTQKDGKSIDRRDTTDGKDRRYSSGVIRSRKDSRAGSIARGGRDSSGGVSTERRKTVSGKDDMKVEDDTIDRRRRDTTDGKDRKYSSGVIRSRKDSGAGSIAKGGRDSRGGVSTERRKTANDSSRKDDTIVEDDKTGSRHNSQARKSGRDSRIKKSVKHDNHDKDGRDSRKDSREEKTGNDNSRKDLKDDVKVKDGKRDSRNPRNDVRNSNERDLRGRKTHHDGGRKYLKDDVRSAILLWQDSSIHDPNNVRGGEDEKDTTSRNVGKEDKYSSGKNFKDKKGPIDGRNSHKRDSTDKKDHKISSGRETRVVNDSKDVRDSGRKSAKDDKDSSKPVKDKRRSRAADADDREKVLKDIEHGKDAKDKSRRKDRSRKDAVEDAEKNEANDDSGKEMRRSGVDSSDRRDHLNATQSKYAPVYNYTLPPLLTDCCKLAVA